MPLEDCLEASIGITMAFNITVSNSCDPADANIADLLVSQSVDGIQTDALMDSPVNVSQSYMTFTWTPQPTQIGSQQLCMIAYTR